MGIHRQLPVMGERKIKARLGEVQINRKIPNDFRFGIDMIFTRVSGMVRYAIANAPYP